jgi:hypothetical protein
MNDHPELIFEAIAIVFSIGCFNLCGISVTKYASSAQRSTIDTCRTLFIWLVSLYLGWENFYIGELFGFLLLVIGTLVYNEIFVVPIACLSRNTKA